MNGNFKEQALGRIVSLCLILFVSLIFPLVTPTPSFSASSDLTISDYQLVSRTRVGRTAYEYTFSASITNTGTEDMENMVGVVSSLVPTTNVTDDTLTFGAIPVGATVPSHDTFTVQINRRYPFNESDLEWRFAYDPNPSIPGIMIGSVSPPAFTETTIIPYPTDEGIVNVEIVKGRVLVDVYQHVEEAVAEQLITSKNGTVIGKIPNLGFYVVEVPFGNELNFINDMRSEPTVQFVIPDYILRPQYTSSPNEGYASQHHLKTINAAQAWGHLANSSVDPKNIEIGVIDVSFQGIKTNEAKQDFNGRLVDTNVETLDEINDHGLIVASVAAATGNNSYGLGVDWSNKIRLQDANCSSDKNGEPICSTGISLHYAAMLISSGFEVINISIGTGNRNGFCDTGESINQVNYLTSWANKVIKINIKYPEKQFLLIKPAGNDGCDLGSVLNLPSILTKPDNLLIVGGSRGDGQGKNIADSRSNRGELIDIVAPFTARSYDYNSSTPDSFSGTSFSAPQVSGAASLIWSYDPSLKTSQQVVQRLKNTTNEITFGLAPTFGDAGVLDVYKALTSHGSVSGDCNLDSNFDSDTTGSYPSGWTASYDPPTGGGVSMYVDDTLSYNPPGKSLHFLDTTSSRQGMLSRTFTPTSSITLEYYMRTHSSSYEGVFVSLYGDSQPYKATFSANFRGNGYIGIHGGCCGWVNPSLLPYNVDTWYFVRRTLDLTTNTGSFYVEEVGNSSNNASFNIGPEYGITNIDGIQMWTSGGQGADVHIDNIRVCQ